MWIHFLQGPVAYPQIRIRDRRVFGRLEVSAFPPGQRYSDTVAQYMTIPIYLVPVIFSIEERSHPTISERESITFVYSRSWGSFHLFLQPPF